MKKVVQYSLVLLLLPQVNLRAQSPVIQQIIDSVSIDSLILVVKELSGEVQTMVNGKSETILSRHRDQPGNALAEVYIKQKLESYGLPVTVQHYSSTGNNVLATQDQGQCSRTRSSLCVHIMMICRKNQLPLAQTTTEMQSRPSLRLPEYFPGILFLARLSMRCGMKKKYSRISLGAHITQIRLLLQATQYLGLKHGNAWLGFQ